MNAYRKRINDLERKKERHLITPVVIAAITECVEYAYKGNIYSKEQFQELMKKVRQDTIILDDTRLKGE